MESVYVALVGLLLVASSIWFIWTNRRLAEAKTQNAQKVSLVATDAERKLTEKDAELARRLAEKDAENARQLAEKDAELARRLAEKDADIAETARRLAEKDAETARRLAERDAENEELRRMLMDNAGDVSDASTSATILSSKLTKKETESLFSHANGNDCCTTYYAPIYCSTNPDHEKFW